MNSSISNKINNFLILHDQFGNIVLKSTNSLPPLSKIWSLVQINNFKISQLTDFIKLNYMYSFDHLEFITKEVYNSHNY